MEETQGSVRWSRRTPKTATYEKRRANRRAIEKLERVPTRRKKRKAPEPLLKVSKTRFSGLAVWKILRVPHSLDVMHITKNVCESLLGTLLNMPEKTKDGPKARYDLQSIGIREELHAGRPNTTRKRLIAALLTTGDYSLKMPAVRSSRVASPYRRRFGLGDARGNLITAGEINSHHYLDRAAPHTAGRWAGTLLAAAVSALRVYYVQGFYVVSYGLGIYLLNLLIGFLSPMVDRS
ncbi:hypothetical protein QYE76_019856 [Lolium multiflorum]|uniref:Uncharacterized protein n=1 Tax=Lolium multiflorum TaxID=4521 RepID=A0AAD8R7A7_LOLMU|nr:hypothetical protein QYE76_019856 [Lolium multiflorum]